jgi:arylsulfatase A-like enzyme
VPNLDPADPLFVGDRPQGVATTVYPIGRENPEAMTYYRSSHGHNDSVIHGIGRIGVQFGGKAALWNDETMADEFVARAKSWIENRDPSRPFFLFFSSQDIHVPRTPHPRFKGKSQLGYRGDAMVQFDWAVGELLATLDHHGIADNTLVILTSDNGPVYDDGYMDGTAVPTSTAEADRGHDGSGPFRGGKYQIYEGGTRVPFLVRWPAKIKPGVSHALVSQVDFLASFAALFGRELAPGEAIDSRNILPALLGEDPHGLPDMIEEAQTLALRMGPWKFIHRPAKPGADELYHLGDDPGEQHNLAAQHPDRTAAMKARLLAIRNAKNGIRALE